MLPILLPPDFVQQNSGRYGGIQRRYAAGHWNSQTDIAYILQLFRYSLSFIADDKGNGTIQIDAP